MRIIIDANVLFSALIKESITRKLILEYDGYFLFPDFIFQEMEKHRHELVEKSEMNETEFKQLLQLILNAINFRTN